MKETLKQAGYKYIKYAGCNQHILQNVDTKNSEIWASNKNHASYGLIYKNTHLEFCSSLPY
jgi:hypothetical protein